VPALIKIDQELLEVGHRRGLDPADEIHSVTTNPRHSPRYYASLRTISTAGKRYAP
jgi:hypothetical protein